MVKNKQKTSRAVTIYQLTENVSILVIIILFHYLKKL